MDFNFIRVYLKAVLQLLPLILETIKTIEEASPAAGSGAAKLSMLRGIILMVYENSGKSVAEFDKDWAAIQQVAELGVRMYNATGVFKINNNK